MLTMVACSNKDKKPSYSKDAKETKEVKEVKKTSTAAFALERAKNDISFTAYKFTEKFPVKGYFKKVNIISGGEGVSVKEAIHNTEFEVPVSSLHTLDTSRDYKIRKFFFDVMTNTKTLTGKFSITDDSSGVVSLTMNSETQDIPFTYTIDGRTFNMKAVMDVNNWKAGEALASLNKICKDLHTGSDGVSKTWSEVALDISSTF
jgi:hypothetical protein